MADNFGLKIGIDGEKDFKNALWDINQSFKVLGSEMNLVTSQFDKNDKSIEAITARNKVLNKEIDTQKEKIDTLENALNNAAASFGETDKRTQSWQVQLNNAKAELNNMQKELRQNDTALNNAGKEFEDAEKESEQFNKALKKTADTADSSEGSLSKLGSVLGKIGAGLGIGVAAIGAAAVGAGKALTDMAVSSAAYADEILTQSTVTGMSTESLQAYKYAAELIDTDIDTLTKTMAKNIKSMDSARDGTGAAAEAYKKLGITVTDSHGNLKDGETVYWQAIDALGQMKNETERDALAMQLFGKSAKELNPLIAQGSEGFSKLTDEAKKMGAVMSTDTLDALGKFDDSVQRLKSGAGAAKNMLGTVLLPQLQLLADDGVSLLGNFTKGMNDAGGDWSKISEVIGSTVGSLANMLLENLPKIIQVGMDILTSIGQAVLDNLPLIIETAVTIVMTLLDGLISALPQLAKGAVQLILALVDGIIANLPELLKAAITVVVTLAQGLAQALPELIPAIVDAVILIVETLIDNVDLLIDAAIAIVIGLAEGIINALPRLIEKIPVLIEKLVTAIINNLPKILEAGITIVIMLAEGLLKAIPQLVSKIPQIVGSILNGIIAYNSKMAEVGSDLIKGVWQGILNMGDWLKEKVKGFFNGIVSGIKDILGIHSPSKVFSGIGENMAEGLGVGFENAMNEVNHMINNSVMPEVNVTGSYQGGGGGVFVNVPVNLDGRIITSATSQIQYTRNQGFARSLGVVI